MTFKTESEARVFLATVKANQDRLRKAGYNISEMYKSLSHKPDNKTASVPNTRSEIGDPDPDLSTATKLVFTSSKPLESGVYLKLNVDYNKKTKAYISRSFSIFGSAVACSFDENPGIWSSSLSGETLTCTVTGYYSKYVSGVGMMIVDSFGISGSGTTSTFNIVLTPLG